MVQVKRTEQEILASEEKYRFVFDNLADAVIIVDLQTELNIDTNHQCEILMGRSRDEIIGMHYLQNHPLEKADFYRWRFALHVQMGRAADYDGELIKKDGTVVPVSVSASTLEVGGRRIMVGIFHDISERKRTEQALIESENRYRDLFTNASNAVFITDLKGKIVEVNQAANALDGYTVKEMARMTIYELLSPESRDIARKIERALLGQQTYRRRGEVEIVRKDGIKVPVETIARLLTQEGQPIGFHFLVRDITQQKQFKENMQFYIAQIIKAQEEERRRIARDIHDETAQSLATLSLNIEAIAKGQLPEGSLKQLEELRSKTSVILEGVRRLCYELRPDVLDNLGLIPALEWLTSELRNERKIRGRIEVIGNERRLSSETELALFRIAQEALNNVKRHSQATEVVVKVQFTRKKFRMSIADNGKGFDLPESPDDFAQRGKLGLIGIKERVRLLNGTLSVVSHKGKGTTLSVEVAA